ncbi:MAG TPA: hypothetical protein DF613_09785 [Lachnospiraceae bacterium]|nr:hypothetical protein [Lachnospiraceae bacterium]
MKKKKNSAETEMSFPQWVGEKGTYIYVLIMLVVFSLYCTNKMFNLVEDRKNFFQYLTVLYAFMLLPAAGQALYKLVKKPSELKLPGIDTVWMLFLLGGILLSTVISGDGKRIFWEMPTARSISGLCFIGCILVYFGVRRFGVFDGPVLWGWMAGSAVIYLFGILCSCGINFMHIQDGVEQRYYFISPLGGSNINATYVCLMLPFLMVMFLVGEGLFARVVSGAYLYMGFLFSFFIKTESSAITMVFGIFLLGYFALEKKEWFERYTQVVGIYLGAKLTIRILLYLFPDRLYPFDGIDLKLLDLKMILAEAAAWGLVAALQCLKKDVFRSAVFCIRKYLLGVVAAAALVFVVSLVAVNLMGEAVPEGSVFRHLMITDATFNARGFIWRRTAALLREEPLINKLFGNGLGSLYDQIYFGADRKALLEYMGGNAFYDPHNEYLQCLVDMGIAGFAGYIGLLVTTLVRALRRWKGSEWQMAVALTLAVYMVQALVNAYSIMHMPLLFIFLGFANGYMLRKGESGYDPLP